MHVVVGVAGKDSLCCPLVISLLPMGIKLNTTTVPHVIVGFWTSRDLISVVVNVLHTDTIKERLTSVQPGNFKTSHSVDKSIKRFNTKVPAYVRSLYLMSFCTEIPLLFSITTNNVDLIEQDTSSTYF